MRFLQSLTSALPLLAAGAAQAASSWSFDEASVSRLSKAKDALNQPFTTTSPASNTISLGGRDSIKIKLTTKENGNPKRPHQAFLVVKQAETGLEAPFPLTMKDNGKGFVELAQKDLPTQLYISDTPLMARLVIGSFGSASALETLAFSLEIERDSNDLTAQRYRPALRYGKLAEQLYTPGKRDEGAPLFISLAFVLLVSATFAGLLIAWPIYGANLKHLSQAVSAAPLSHAAFFGSILAMEGVFFAYYIGYKLLAVLPFIAIVGATAFLSGSKALGEVQSRRLAGQR